MNQSRTYLLLGAVLALGVCLLVAPAGCGRDQGVPGDFYYKIETGNVQSGYAVLDTATVVEHGEVRLRLEAKTHTEFTLLGSDVDSQGRLIYDLLPPDKRVVRIQGESVSGTQSTTWNLEVSGGRVSGSSPLKGKDWSMDLPPDVIIENMLFFDHVTRDLVDAGLTEKTYRVLDVLDLEVRECRYEKQGEETLHLGGADYPVIVVDQAVEETNTLVRLWIDTRTAMAVKVLQQDGNVITLAGPSVVDGVRRVDMDKYILDETNVAIADVPAISYMKVRARIRPIGLRPTPESLNVPGQSFQGDGGEQPDRRNLRDRAPAVRWYRRSSLSRARSTRRFRGIPGSRQRIRGGRHGSGGEGPEAHRRCRRHLGGGHPALPVGHRRDLLCHPRGRDGPQHLQPPGRGVRCSFDPARHLLSRRRNPRARGLGLHVHARSGRRLRPARMDRGSHGAGGMDPGGRHRGRNGLRGFRSHPGGGAGIDRLPAERPGVRDSRLPAVRRGHELRGGRGTLCVLLRNVSSRRIARTVRGQRHGRLPGGQPPEPRPLGPERSRRSGTLGVQDDKGAVSDLRSRG